MWFSRCTLSRFHLKSYLCKSCKPQCVQFQTILLQDGETITQVQTLDPEAAVAVQQQLQQQIQQQQQQQQQAQQQQQVQQAAAAQQEKQSKVLISEHNVCFLMFHLAIVGTC